MKQPKMMYIEWVDSLVPTSRWEFHEDLPPMEPIECFTVGYLIEKTDKLVTICQSWSVDQVLGRATIPRCAIKKMRTLK